MPGSPDVFLRENLLLLADHLGEPKFMARCVRDKCHVSGRDPALPPNEAPLLQFIGAFHHPTQDAVVFDTAT